MTVHSVYTVDTSDDDVYVAPAPAAAAGAGSAAALPAALAPVAKAVDDIFRRSQELLADVQAKNIRTPERIFRCTDLYHITGDLEKLYAERGDALLQMCDLNYDLNRARIIYREAVEGLTITYPSSVAHFAIAEKERVATSLELSVMAICLARSKGLSAIAATLEGKEQPDEKHNVVLISEDATAKQLQGRIITIGKLDNYEFLKVLPRLTGCVVVDPYLGKVFRAEEAGRQPDFVASLRALGVHFIEAIHLNPPTQEAMDTVLREVEILDAAVQEAGGIQGVSSDMLKSFEPSYNFVKTKRHQLAITALVRRFEASRDKWKLARTGELWGRFDKTLAQEIHTALTALGIRAAVNQESGKDTYVVQIPFNSYDTIKDSYEKIKRLNSAATAVTTAAAV